MTEPYDKNGYILVMTCGGLTLPAAIALAEQLVSTHGGRASVYRRQRPGWLARRIRVATFMRGKR